MNSLLRKKLSLASACLAFVIVILDVSVVNVALQQIYGEFEGRLAHLEWVVNGYTLTFASFLLTTGSLGDRFGPKRVFLVGFALFALASWMCGNAASLTALIVFRLLQGIGAALVVPASLAIVNQTFPEANERSRAIGLWAAAGGMALALGPVFGGTLISMFGWRSIFYVNIPIAALGITLASIFVLEKTTLSDRRIDITGQVLAVAALGCLTYALIQVNTYGVQSYEVLLSAMGFVVATALFIMVEHHSAAPMLPLYMFANRQFRAAALIGVMINFAFYGLVFLFSLYFQYSWHYSPLETGLAFLPMTGAIMLANLYSAKLMVRSGFRKTLLIGTCLAAAGYIAIVPFLSDHSYGAMLIQFIVAGFGIGLAVPAVTNAMVSSAESKHIGVASGVLNASRQIGGLIGVASMGLVLGDFAPESFNRGIGPALVVASFALMLCVALVLTSFSKPQTTLSKATS
ncbi:Major facilitator superfamily MFS multidrug efflux pump [Pseudomonas syringae pv. maculicola]|uniref:Major facilitator superfamily multidrug efflux pump n=1 Tax=Pseudomonas savastanoi pv. glycinea TaxID=318 RepID=A0A3M3G271_PSESG|nr:MFS transporter [Pseudomonas savastanoi]KPB86325.1 Major facilitator superfamily MFS multidrug efflux pump [Pseudomonas syringae pv. maculicola]MBN4178233.1 Multidrug resistance protein Stp [Pseudomonas savastanoi pv. phaseolicola]RMM68341.1 Major facilitator superfamily multidrug efflux pump [Pseudomonas savastanoi pv. glycinea]